MANAHKETESLKKHGDVLESAIEDVDRHKAGAKVDPIPMPDDGAHEKSHAAHLGGTVHDRTRPEGNLRHGTAPGELREPPQEISRIGKEHRKQ
jgi:hypothetical protein